jgi:uroporphyrinogen decarboxylase
MSTEHILLKALRGENVPRPPVWMMRQAGRYLPEYMVLRRKYDFFTRVQTPELAAEITLQPINIIGPDAAILFSDILVIPQALGQEVQMVNNKGPYLPKTIENQVDINSLRNIEESADSLQYVYDAITLTKKELNNKVPLIGFAGAPFTILCYMVEGQGSKTFSKAKGFCFSQPTLAHELLSKITDLTIAYLKRKVAAGADVIQVFDSWSGLLSADDFNNFAKPYLDKITNALSEIAPVIIFAKGSWYALRDLTSSNASALGIDWCISPKQARDLTNHSITLQGNFDPHKLLLPIPELKNEVKAMIDSFGPQKYIANLGHGILPNIPVDHAKAFVDAVKGYNS